VIAWELSLSESTVKGYVHSLIAKLGVTNRTEAAFLAAEALGAPRPRGRAVAASPAEALREAV